MATSSSRLNCSNTSSARAIATSKDSSRKRTSFEPYRKTNYSVNSSLRSRERHDTSATARRRLLLDARRPTKSFLVFFFSSICSLFARCIHFPIGRTSLCLLCFSLSYVFLFCQRKPPARSLARRGRQERSITSDRRRGKRAFDRIMIHNKSCSSAFVRASRAQRTFLHDEEKNKSSCLERFI